jgi:hypothetical protein
MTLEDLYNEQGAKSDKGTVHDYIVGYYSKEFLNKRNEKIKLMEIGVHRGPSIVLWKSWFKDSEIVGVDNEDIYDCERIYDKLIIDDAYTDQFINNFSDGYFDYIIDDGPHTLESQIISATKWIYKIKPGGKLIIEDIQSIEWISSLQDSLDKSIVSDYKVFDLRNNKNRYDDIIFEVTKK